MGNPSSSARRFTSRWKIHSAGRVNGDLANPSTKAFGPATIPKSATALAHRGKWSPRPAAVTERQQRGGLIIARTFQDPSSADVIIGVDGQRIETADDFLELIERHQPGEQAVIAVVRDGHEFNIPVLLGADE